MNDHVHIVCLDAPAPPDYGGAIEMYYKIKAFHELGKKIILHYFKYNNRSVFGLERFCTEINSYTRKPLWQTIFTSAPYIIHSRINMKLINRLNEDNYPIILEGFHCTGIIPYLKNRDRKMVVRVHNNEAAYYRGLALSETSFFIKAYFKRESRLLKVYQRKFTPSVKSACVSKADIKDLSENYGLTNLYYIPCFIPWDFISIIPGKGNFCLYHGNLSVPENEKAAKFLINLFSVIGISLIIAGKNPSKSLQAQVAKSNDITLIQNASNEELAQLISNAHIHVLPSFNTTGIKFKLLHALFNGRFCITNQHGSSGIPQIAGLTIVESHQDFIQEICRLMPLSFTNEMVRERSSIQELYNNAISAHKLNALLL